MNSDLTVGYYNIEMIILTGSEQSLELIENTYYKCTEPQTSVTITLKNPDYPNIVNNYIIEFTSSSSGCVLLVPQDIKWANGIVPTIDANVTHQLSIINNLAVMSKFI
jgi:hypothetical protein